MNKPIKADDRRCLNYIKLYVSLLSIESTNERGRKSRTRN